MNDQTQTPAKQRSAVTKRRGPFRQPEIERKLNGKSRLRVALYARVSTKDQQTNAMQLKAMRSHARLRGWKVQAEYADVNSGAVARPLRERVMKFARQRNIDVVCVWRLDRWGRSVADLALTMKELHELGVAFVSVTEGVDLTTPTGRAMAGMLSVFAEFEREVLRERIQAGMLEARKRGKAFGRPVTIAPLASIIKSLRDKGLTKAEIARRCKIARSSVRRYLA